MFGRLLTAVVALAALTTLTAFAPAPFPKPGRRPPGRSLDARWLEGTWKVDRVERTINGGYQPARSVTSTVRVGEGKWTFIRSAAVKGGGREVSYRLVLHTNQVPIRLDGMRANSDTPYMRGIVRRVGDTIEVLYRFNGEHPTSFDNPPAGCWRITMRREK